MWVHQVHDFGLGNTISCTPAIEWLSNKHKRPIPVYFDLDFVRDCFLDCPFVEILDSKPKSEPIFTSVLTGTSWNTKPDYQYIFEAVSGEKWNGQRCYVDQPIDESFRDFKKVVTFVSGSGSEDRKYLDTKEIEAATYRAAVKAVRRNGMTPIFVGSEKDLARCEWSKDMVCMVGDVRKALGLISISDYVIGNDTGLIHAAGAMNKPMFVFWKDTQLPRCQNSGDRCFYLMKSVHGQINRLIDGFHRK